LMMHPIRQRRSSEISPIHDSHKFTRWPSMKVLKPADINHLRKSSDPKQMQDRECPRVCQERSNNRVRLCDQSVDRRPLLQGRVVDHRCMPGARARYVILFRMHGARARYIILEIPEARAPSLAPCTRTHRRLT